MGKIFKYLGPIIIYMVIYFDISRNKSKGYRIFIPFIIIGLVASLILGISDLRGRLDGSLEYYLKIMNILIFMAYLIVTRFKFKKD